MSLKTRQQLTVALALGVTACAIGVLVAAILGGRLIQWAGFLVVLANTALMWHWIDLNRRLRQHLAEWEAASQLWKERLEDD